MVVGFGWGVGGGWWVVCGFCGFFGGVVGLCLGLGGGGGGFVGYFGVVGRGGGFELLGIGVEVILVFEMRWFFNF